MRNDKADKKVESNNAFVKREQAKMKGMMGNRPKVPKAMMEFDAYMSNDGKAAEAFGRAATKGLEDAYPANFNSAIDHV